MFSIWGTNDCDVLTQGNRVRVLLYVHSTGLVYFSTPDTEHLRPCPGTASKSTHFPVILPPKACMWVYMGRMTTRQAEQ